MALVGTIAIAALLVAVYVSYGANSGLPLKEYRTFRVELPDANRLVRASQVRIAGMRVGLVEKVGAVSPSADDPTGRLRAWAEVKLPADAQRIPVDSTVSVRPASVLGATYLDIVPGRSSRSLENGETLPLRQARERVELTDLLDVFDRRTRRSVQGTITALGDGLVGRGAALGETVSLTRRLLEPLRLVADNLADPATRLGPAISSYDRLVGAFSAERPALERGVTGASRTFAALSRSRPALGATIDRLPGTAATTTAALARLRPALEDLAGVSARLRPAALRLPAGLTALNDVFRDATGAFRAFRPASPRLGAAGEALRVFAERPQVDGLVRKLGDTFVAAEPVVAASADAQEYCNSIAVFAQNITSVFGDNGFGEGPAVIGVRLKSLGGSSPIEMLQNGEKLPGLHLNYTPKQNAQECEAGNEPFSFDRQSLTNPPGLQSRSHVETTVDPEMTRQARAAGLFDPIPESVKP
ncbi:MlaD family protein [Patulibacter brassicae]|uniref:MlaD family protein n=1 Tax=Patulibacter brassicae TaxID=1705717 RepID=A0ABU4VPJ6_9ACTN|nr:MlaD family protein [Patulibacter brassicae]MDX8153789.1 MlaD family protein [Patulibacter brassicae]